MASRTPPSVSIAFCAERGDVSAPGGSVLVCARSARADPGAVLVCARSARADPGALLVCARSARADPGAFAASPSLVAPVASLPALLSPGDAGPGAVV